MNVEKCAKGHMYDASIYSTCPYCRISLKPEKQVNQGAETIMRAASGSRSSFESGRPVRSAYGGYETGSRVRETEEERLAAEREAAERAEAERIAEVERAREEKMAEAKKAADASKIIDQTDNDRMPCPKCGYLSKIGSKFCRNCGERLIAPEKVEAEIVEPTEHAVFVEPEPVEFHSETKPQEEYVKYESEVKEEPRHEPKPEHKQEPKREPQPEEEYSQPNFTLVKEKTPVVGWLVCVEGEHYGDSFEIRKGDRIRIGDEKFVLVPLVGNGFEWK